MTKWINTQTENSYYLVEETELIRCKDCKHFNQPTCPMVVSLPIKSEQRTSGWVNTFRNTADDFCSKAERKDND